MSKGYIVNRAFNAPSLGDVWISPDTAHMVGQLSGPELKHHLDTGALTEIDLPPGCTTVAQALALEDAKQQAKKAASNAAVEESTAEANAKAAAAVEAAKEALGPKATPAKKGGR